MASSSCPSRRDPLCESPTFSGPGRSSLTCGQTIRAGSGAGRDRTEHGSWPVARGPQQALRDRWPFSSHRSEEAADSSAGTEAGGRVVETGGLWQTRLGSDPTPPQTHSAQSLAEARDRKSAEASPAHDGSREGPFFASLRFLGHGRPQAGGCIVAAASARRRLLLRTQGECPFAASPCLSPVRTLVIGGSPPPRMSSSWVLYLNYSQKDLDSR